MIPDDELTRMRRDAEIDGIRARAETLAGHRSVYEPEPFADGRGALWSLLKLLMAHNWEADVLALLDVLAAERARADAAEARVRELEKACAYLATAPSRSVARRVAEQSKVPIRPTLGVETIDRIAESMGRKPAVSDPAELARLRQIEVEIRSISGPGGKS